MDAADLATLLASSGISNPTYLAQIEGWAAKHLQSDGANGVETTDLTDGSYNPLPQQLTPDGHDIQILVLQNIYGDNTVDLSAFPKLHIIDMENENTPVPIGPIHNLTVIGAGNVDIYGDGDLDLSGTTGNINVHMGGASDSVVTGGSGTENISFVANGTHDVVNAGTGTEHITASGPDNVFNMGAGANSAVDLVKGSYGTATVNMSTGNNAVVSLNQTGNNTVNVAIAANVTETIKGTVASDTVHFADVLANVTETAVKGGTLYDFADGQHVTILGVAAVTFADHA
jgi:hypothetical protein